MFQQKACVPLDCNRGDYHWVQCKGVTSRRFSRLSCSHMTHGRGRENIVLVPVYWHSGSSFDPCVYPARMKWAASVLCSRRLCQVPRAGEVTKALALYRSQSGSRQQAHSSRAEYSVCAAREVMWWKCVQRAMVAIPQEWTLGEQIGSTQQRWGRAAHGWPGSARVSQELLQMPLCSVCMMLDAGQSPPQ